MSRVSAFVVFCYDFIVGDDWRVAVGVIAALAITFGVSTIIPSWWVVPAAVMLLLPISVWRAARRARPGTTS